MFCLLLLISFSLSFSLSSSLSFPLSLSDNGTYTCSELQRWLKLEKHYSNERKNSLFDLLTESDCKKYSVIRIDEISYSSSLTSPSSASVSSSSTNKNKKYFFLQSEQGKNHGKKCSMKDKVAVLYLSNFSINHNFSHFLHSLLRLFCALIDAKFIQWNSLTNSFQKVEDYVIWMDENFKLSSSLNEWLKPFGIFRELKSIPSGDCIHATTLVYGSGCVKLLPPEKWYGYPGCRAHQILPAFAHFMKSFYQSSLVLDPVVMDPSHPIRLIDFKKDYNISVEENTSSKIDHLNIAFGVRNVGALTGTRSISNLASIQSHLSRSLRISHSISNITFESLSPSRVIHAMSQIHIFISIHGAGLTNTFFMSPGSVLVEILPYPLCSCRSPDYFYGMGGYYHGSSLALSLKHYTYCVDSYHTIFHTKPENDREKERNPVNNIEGGKCSWKLLHLVQEIILNEGQFNSLMRRIERDLIAEGVIELKGPIINMNPHANGR